MALRSLVIDLGKIEGNVNMGELKETLTYVMRKIKIKERIIGVFFKYYDGGETFQSIGDEIGVTRQRVNNMIKSALNRINSYENIDEVLKLGYSALSEEEKKRDEYCANLKGDICELCFSFRVNHYLRENGINTIGQLLAMSDEELLAIKKLGKTSLKEIKEKLSEEGYIDCTRTAKKDIKIVMDRFNLNKEKLIKIIEEL